jgi:hypothetical protein
MSIMKNLDKVIALLLAALYLALALLTLSGTGITWDEPRYISQAKARAYSIYATATGKPDLFFCNISGDFTATTEELLEGNITNSQVPEWAERCWEGRARSTGTLSGLTWAAVWYANGMHLDVISSIAAHRLSTVFLTAIGVAVVFIFILQSYNRRAAIFGSLALIFMPVFFAHSKYMLFDQPSAILWVITIFVFWKGLSNRWYGLLLGPVYAVALTTKEQVLFIPVVMAIWLAITYREDIMKKLMTLKKQHLPGLGALRPRMKNKFHIQLLSLILLTPLFLFMLWPWLWQKTPERLSWWISYYLYHIRGAPANPQFFMGEIVSSTPFYLPALMIIVTTPLVILAFASLGGFKALKDIRNHERPVSLLILLAALFPVLVLMRISVSYNGIQQSLAALPFIAMLSGIGADYFLKRIEPLKALKKIPFRKEAMLVLLLALFVLPGLIATAKGHTDAYFSEIVGGPGGVYESGMFESEWSGEAYLDTVLWLNENAQEGARVYVPMGHNIFLTYKYGDIGEIAERLKIEDQNLNPTWFRQEALLRSDITVSDPYEVNANDSIEFDYVVVLSRFGLFSEDSFYVRKIQKYLDSCEPVYSTMLDGAPLVRVYKADCV